ncbi:YpmS family protein [Salipaludibacillus agaradhaerens]|uniref:YpmS family protein n=1 Tax=Salipaludibacillus agaradhaerens TaxID=76935 RepID=UPI0021510870|nr:YpmS family protein [Salipaludibacillus agaradhaerens]MCR6106157.1 YpmS family protein [Salipaludibacillus agaradhaerens]MCR6118190.1 YpmS family protein [Salipaludibacillus agaradhaerens]UJW57308.1 YpmS family protein [Bacillus sp. A116_S68]
MRTSLNKWRNAFFILTATVVLVIMSAVGWLYFGLPNTSSNDFVPPHISDKEGASFSVETSTEDLNFWLQNKLNNEEGTEFYSIYIDDAVYFEATVDAFGITLPIYMILSPHVTDEGNIELLEESFSVGNISLPSTRVFELIESRTDLPEWISVIPNEQKLYVNVREGMSENVEIKVTSFDLSLDDIEFDIRFIQ